MNLPRKSDSLDLTKANTLHLKIDVFQRCFRPVFREGTPPITQTFQVPKMEESSPTKAVWIRLMFSGVPTPENSLFSGTLPPNEVPELFGDPSY